MSGTRGSKDVSPCGTRAKIIFNLPKNLRVRGAHRGRKASGAPGFPPVLKPVFITKLLGNVLYLERVIGRDWAGTGQNGGAFCPMFLELLGLWRGAMQCKRERTSSCDFHTEDLISVASLLFSEEGVRCCRRCVVLQSTPP